MKTVKDTSKTTLTGFVMLLTAAILAMPIPALARNLLVPTQYETIEEAVADAEDWDWIFVFPGTYHLQNADGIDFAGKKITLQSTDPEEPAVVAGTIIDCQSEGRAFKFHSGEGPDSVVSGFTIINGLITGPQGADESIPGGPIDPMDPASPSRANSGEDAEGDGKGGAIYCSGSSPVISYCVINNCTVMGAIGGNGADGQDGPWTFVILPGPGQPEEEVEIADGQWGGHGGSATGNGYGGAIFCGNGSNPIITECTIKRNEALGPRGGNGGNGGDADGSGSESYGGDAGDSTGYAYGGGLYCDSTSAPIITNCLFDGNVADNDWYNAKAQPGAPGAGAALDPPATAGEPAEIDGEGHGGAAYYETGSYADFDNVEFIANSCYFYTYYFDSEKEEWIEEADHTAGGGIHCEDDVTVELVDCTFLVNLGSALYCTGGATLDIFGCWFDSQAAHGSKGGAVYNGPGGSATITDCLFEYNWTPGDGAGLYAEENTDLTISGCVFSVNTADGIGGGVYILGKPGQSMTTITDCIFTGNDAYDWGGGLAADYFDGIIADSYFVGNIAPDAAGLYFMETSETTEITNCMISNNEASGNYGGGVWCVMSSPTISDCIISNNSVLSPLGAGGGLNFTAEAPTVKNCLISDNFAGKSGGAIACNIFCTAEISNCTISGNEAEGNPPLEAGRGGGVHCDKYSSATVINCIFDNCTNHAIYENDEGVIGFGDVTAMYNIFHNNPDGDFFDEGETSYTGAAAINANVAEAINNIDGNPWYVSGLLGDYYLNQSDSPAVDEGSTDANSLGLDAYTTSVDNELDLERVDIGYHYPDVTTVPQYQLTVTVLEGEGTVEPGSGSYYASSVVTLTAIPGTNNWLKDWSGGTIDDKSTSNVNKVLMTSDKEITVKFRTGITIHVPGDKTSIQDAIDTAENGDTVLVAMGVYNTSWGYQIVNKAITISSSNPDDPDVVANTIIEMEVGAEGGVGSAFYFSNVGHTTVLNGFTIRGFNINGPDGLDGDADPFFDGEPGWSVSGSAIGFYLASPTIKNCIITDCSANGGNGGTGAGGDEEHPAGGHGGWPGRAYGGAMYCGGYSSPTVINCTFNNCSAIGGNGGDGGNGNDDPDDILDGGGGRGGGWYYGYSVNWEYSYTDYYTKYSGRGGAVYIDGSSSPTFKDCTFTNNWTEGGTSGVCGINGWLPNLRDEPSINWDIDNHGGAVYMGAGSEAQFIGCLFSNNTADTDTVEEHYDPYVSYGGAVFYEEGATPTFNDCTFLGNEATIGGGMYFWEQSNPTITNCNFINNMAYHGGGIFAADSAGTIKGCNISGNQATTSFVPGADEIYGQGGGIYCFGGPMAFEDCLISGNTAVMSGGGMYLGGSEVEPISLTLYNCLITENSAGRDGGGISCDWYSEPNIINCTISGNVATGEPPFDTGYGGGLYCSYESNANLINSILWGNSGTGQSLALATEYDPDPRPATLTVQYCDVQGGQQAMWVEQGCTLNWLEGNISDDPLFVNGYYLSQIAVGQAFNSPCVNAGSDYAEAIGLCSRSTRTDGAPDAGTVDMGYHYPLVTIEISSDFDNDGDIDMTDLATLLSYWLEQDCDLLPNWCERADLDLDRDVDFIDYALFARAYAPFVDTYPPEPDPSTWQIEPYEISPFTISMTATAATDESGIVEYYFDCTSGACSDSGWQSGPMYVDGVSGTGSYCYTVRTRDGYDNQTTPSVERCVLVESDVTAPDPNPSQWDIEPHPISSSEIHMKAVTASDLSGPVEYEFVCVSDPGHSSGWQSSSEYTDMGLTPLTEYCYQVRTRDSYNNIGIYSVQRCATTLP